MKKEGRGSVMVVKSKGILKAKIGDVPILVFSFSLKGEDFRISKSKNHCESGTFAKLQTPRDVTVKGKKL